MPILAVVQECLIGNTRMGAALWGVQISQDDTILQSAFFDILLPSAVIPPSDFIGKVKIEKHHLIGKDIINKLSWQPSPDPSVVGYLIRGSDGSVRRVSAAGPFQATFHCRRIHRTYTYTIVAFNAEGQESRPLTVSLSAN